MHSSPENGRPLLLPLEKWRMVALEFHAIRSCWESRKLVSDFAPVDLAELPRASMTPSVQGVVGFLLHIWNTDNPFDLSEIQRWDRYHRRAFTAWVLGEITGEPCHYF